MQAYCKSKANTCLNTIWKIFFWLIKHLQNSNPLIHVEFILSSRFVCAPTSVTKSSIFFPNRPLDSALIQNQTTGVFVRLVGRVRGSRGSLGFTLWKWYEVACVSQASPFLQIWLLKDGPPNSQCFRRTIFPTSSITPLWGSHSFQTYIHLFSPRNENQNTHEIQK